MFSSPSAWHYELAGFSRIRYAGVTFIVVLDLIFSGFAPNLYLTAASTMGLTSANVYINASSGLTGFLWQRNGGTQCGKAVGRSYVSMH